MTLEEIKQRVKDIEEKKDDDEVAHEHEDVLYADFIEYVAKTGNKKLKTMAKEVLKTGKIRFSRWCA